MAKVMGDGTVHYTAPDASVQAGAVSYHQQHFSSARPGVAWQSQSVLVQAPYFPSQDQEAIQCQYACNK